MSKQVTVVWDYHGSGQLVGVFDDQEAVLQLERLVRDGRQESYVRFAVVRLNEVVSTTFANPGGPGR